MLKIFDLKQTDAGSVYIRLNGRTKENTDITDYVRDILSNVIKLGDKALKEYTLKYDGVELNDIPFRISVDEIIKARNSVSQEMKCIIMQAAENIKDFHLKQKNNSWFETYKDGTILGQLLTPIRQVGVYVPGGTAGSVPLISTVLMNVIPAKIAGVERIVMVTPPGKTGEINPYLLYAAEVAGADEIYRVGGAQAIGALAYGTESINPVDKIIGPGNKYVAVAKRLVFGKCGIDQFAGPSEISVLADSTANPTFVAADLLSQAEHDKMAAVILVTDSPELVYKVNLKLQELIKNLDKQDICKSALENFGCAVITKDIYQGIDIINKIAPEHLEILTQNPFDLLAFIKNAGAIFIGENSPEPVGDYFAGPNHVLPTSGTAKFSSPLGVYDFMKKSSVISYSKKALLDNGEKIISFASAENLTAHAQAVKVRLEEMTEDE